MISTTKVPLSESELQKLRDLFAHPGFELLVGCIKAKMAALKVEIGEQAVLSEAAYWNPKLGDGMKEKVVDAATLQIFLSVVDEVRADGYEFYRVTLTA